MRGRFAGRAGAATPASAPACCWCGRKAFGSLPRARRGRRHRHGAALHGAVGLLLGASTEGARLEVIAPPDAVARATRSALDADRRGSASSTPRTAHDARPRPGSCRLAPARAAGCGSSPTRWRWCSSTGCAVRRDGPWRTCASSRAGLRSGRRSGAASGSRWRASSWPALIGVPLAFLFERVDFPARGAAGRAGGPAGGAAAAGRGRLRSSSSMARRGSSPPGAVSSSGSTTRRGGSRVPVAILLVHALFDVRVFLPVLPGRAFPARWRDARGGLGARGRPLADAPAGDPSQLRPALAGAALLTFMTALASFSAPYIFGGGFRVMTTQIVSTRLNGDDRLAMVETTALMLLALAALCAVSRGGSGGRARAIGKGTAPARPRRERAHPGRHRRCRMAGWRSCCCCRT